MLTINVSVIEYNKLFYSILFLGYYMNDGEARRSSRYRGNLPVIMDTGSGVTRDFSLRGVYFLTPKQLAVGEMIEFSIGLNHEPAVHKVQLICSGEILRVEPQSQRFGVAVRLITYSFSGSNNGRPDTEH